MTTSKKTHPQDSAPPVGADNGTGSAISLAATRGDRAWTFRDVHGPLLTLDLDELLKNDVEYPVQVHYGPTREPFFWFSGKFDRYHGHTYATEARDVHATELDGASTLAYTLVDPRQHLVIPTSISVASTPAQDIYAIRVRQQLQAAGRPSWEGNVEFLHLVINERYGRDWEDGVPDWVWYRAQREDAPDTLAGSHTTLIRMKDRSTRVYPYPCSTTDPSKIALSGMGHTGAAVSFEAVNTVGGWFTKSGTGCIGLVFHAYDATWRDDLRPLHSHCGDGADSHHYAFWNEMFTPLGMSKGDELLLDYSLFLLPAEPLPTDIDELNEADIWYFGKESEQHAPITAWTASKDAIGLVRGDGSIIALGIGDREGTLPLPDGPHPRFACLCYDRRRPRVEPLEPTDARIPTRPGWLTIVDRGAAIRRLDEAHPADPKR